jgi:hypothetical protein
MIEADGGSRFEIDLEKLFGDDKKLALPAFKTKAKPYLTTKPMQDIMSEVK